MTKHSKPLACSLNLSIFNFKTRDSFKLRNGLNSPYKALGIQSNIIILIIFQFK